MTADEECDDGNTVDGDGCDATCKLEPFCGDGTLDGGEQCDDGNNVDGDGCDANCLDETSIFYVFFVIGNFIVGIINDFLGLIFPGP